MEETRFVINNEVVNIWSTALIFPSRPAREKKSRREQ